MISAEEQAYRQRILAQTEHWANVQMPALFRSVHGQRLTPIPGAAVAAPATPIPESRLADTGAMERLRETATVPIIKLLPEEETRALVSKAVRWFFELRGRLPDVIGLNPLRCLAINQTYFAVEGCEDIGCFTVEIEPVAELARDRVRCQVEGICGDIMRGFSWGVIEDYYL